MPADSLQMLAKQLCDFRKATVNQLSVNDAVNRQVTDLELLVVLPRGEREAVAELRGIRRHYL